MEQPRDIVYAEVYELLKNIEKVKVMKIPREILQEINNGRNKEIKIEYKWDRLLEEETFYPDTIDILGYLNYTYWAESEEEKSALRKIYNIPDPVINPPIINQNMFENKENNLNTNLVPQNEQKDIYQQKATLFDKIKEFFKK